MAGPGRLECPGCVQARAAVVLPAPTRRELVAALVSAPDEVVVGYWVCWTVAVGVCPFWACWERMVSMRARGATAARSESSIRYFGW